MMMVTFLPLLLLLAHTTAAIDRPCVTPENEAGSCKAVASCPKVRQLLQEASSSGNTLLIAHAREYVNNCGSDFRNLEVCCPLSTEEPQPQGQPNAISISPEIKKTMRDCGETLLADKIVDGEDSKLFAWPWTVLLLGQDGNGREMWHCGGSLISTRYVLSAAHCFRDPAIPGLKVLKVRVGEHDLYANPDCAGNSCLQFVDLDLEEELLHPAFNDGCQTCNDLALIRLSQDVAFLAPQVTPICLSLDPQRDFGYSISGLRRSRKRAIISGWGSVSRDPYSVNLPPIMQQASVPLGQTDFCVFLRQNMTEPNSVLCAGGEGPDACRGDSGGPLALINQEGTKWYLLGVTSKGYKICGAPHTQSFYTNVHHYLPWILQNMKP